MVETRRLPVNKKCGEEPYDSTADTKEHILEVQSNLYDVIMIIERRLRFHDASKLVAPEKEMFDEFTLELRDLTYGGEAYKDCREEMMGQALGHHYENNPHHPEHFPNGIEGMSLLDLIEMLADWAAAVKRHADGDLMESITFNTGRFGMSEQLAKIMENTVVEMGWDRG